MSYPENFMSMEIVLKIESKDIFNYVSAFWTMYFECMKDTLNFLDNVGAYLWLSILSIFGILRSMVILNYEKYGSFLNFLNYVNYDWFFELWEAWNYNVCGLWK